MRHCALDPGLPAEPHQDVLVRLPVPGNTELTAAVRRYVTPATGRLPRYLQLLHGNFVALDARKRRRFLSRLARSARQVSDRELAALLENGWRSRLTASWLIGLDTREQFRDRIGELLLDSEAAYAGQGYCLALARFATPADASLLAAYLATYLPQPDKRYDQDWALGALLHIDAALGTDHAAPFLTDGGLWQQWRTTEESPAELRAWIEQLCTVADECMHKTRTTKLAGTRLLGVWPASGMR
jgi:Family of unknown function (DUF6000)